MNNIKRIFLFVSFGLSLSGISSAFQLPTKIQVYNLINPYSPTPTSFSPSITIKTPEPGCDLITPAGATGSAHQVKFNLSDPGFKAYWGPGSLGQDPVTINLKSSGGSCQLILSKYYGIKVKIQQQPANSCANLGISTNFNQDMNIVKIFFNNNSAIHSGLF